MSFEGSRVLHGKILVPLLIKFVGMASLFLIANMIIDQVGLDLYGIYAQTISLLMFFMSLASLGFAQSFIRKSANLGGKEKLQLFNNQNRLIFTNSIILLPLLYFVLDSLLEKVGTSILSLVLFFLIVSTFRIRFSYIRTTKLVRFAELPDMIIRQVSFVVLIYVFGVESESELYFFAMIAILTAYVSQAIMLPTLKIAKNHRFVGVRHYRENIEKNDLKIWVFNSLVQLKEFFEISLVIFAVGALAAGQYKLLIQFSLAFMAIFNSLNLVNSSAFAKFIDDGDFSEIKKVAGIELKQGLVFYILLLSGFIVLTQFLDVFSIFSLPDGSYEIFYLVLMFSLLNLLFGPVTQLCMHLKELDTLNLLYSVRLLLMIPVGLISVSGYDLSLMFVVSWLVTLEFAFLAGASVQLSRHYGLIPAVFLALRRG